EALGFLPALGSALVAATAFDPARAFAGVFLLPEGCAGLQVVHDDIAGIERRLAMGAAGTDEDDGLARLQTADAMDDLDTQQRPALTRFIGNPGQGLLGHAGKMFEEHAADFAPLVEVAYIADEAHLRANAEVGGMQGIELGAGIEGLGLYTDGHALCLA